MDVAVAGVRAGAGQSRNPVIQISDPTHPQTVPE